MPIKPTNSSTIGTNKPIPNPGEARSTGNKQGKAPHDKSSANDHQVNTLGDYLHETGTQAKDLLQAKWQLHAAAVDLLQSRGIGSPSKSQIAEVSAGIAEAINAGQWKNFSPEIRQHVVRLADGVNQRLGNIFGEKQVFSESQLKADSLKLPPSLQRVLRGDYESGRSGMIMAASFINTPSRAEGDFSHAYGDKAWRGFMRAHNYLDSIPKGEFIDKLDLDVICKTNELVMAADKGVTAWLLSAVAAIGRGGHWARAGKIREGRQFAHPQMYTEQQLKNMEQAGVDVMRIYSGDDGTYAMLEYPKPETIKPRLKELIKTLRDSLAQEDADPSTPQRSFSAALSPCTPLATATAAARAC